MGQSWVGKGFGGLEERRGICAPQSGWVKQNKSYFYPGQPELEDWQCVCVWNRDCKRARRVQREQFSDLQLAHGVMLFIFVPLRVSVWVQLRCSGIRRTHQVSGKMRKKKKTQTRPWTGRAYSVSFTYNSPLGDLRARTASLFFSHSLSRLLFLSLTDSLSPYSSVFCLLY